MAENLNRTANVSHVGSSTKTQVEINLQSGTLYVRLFVANMANGRKGCSAYAAVAAALLALVQTKC